jgi:hypothetical protein
MPVKNVLKKSTPVVGQHVISVWCGCYQAATLQETKPLLKGK